MGTRALGDAPLLVVEPTRYRAELALKATILAGDARYYCQAPPATLPLQWETLGLLLPELARHYPQHFDLATDGAEWVWTNRLLGTRTTFRPDDAASLPHAPLDWLGRQVHEDLLLLDGTAPGTPLVAGHLCFAAGWCLDDKMGQSFLAIHGPVPTFAQAIGRPADLLMQRLKPGHPAWRTGWAITTTADLNRAPRVAHRWCHLAREITPATAGERLHLRFERQTFSRLPATGGVLFTIHTYQAPLAEAVATPEQARRLASLLRTMPPAVRAYKGLPPLLDAALAYLDGRGQSAASSSADDEAAGGAAGSGRLPA
jgi:hypothetical protein